MEHEGERTGNLQKALLQHSFKVYFCYPPAHNLSFVKESLFEHVFFFLLLLVPIPFSGMCFKSRAPFNFMDLILLS